MDDTAASLRAQDPDELFDIVRADGTPTGQTKRRADVHRDGDWHRAVHVWVYGQREGAPPFVLVQRRGLHKDTHPGGYDATVAGHLGAGETTEEAFREVEEELGIVPNAVELRHIGTRYAVTETVSGLTDREIQEVFALRDDRALAAYRPNAAEVGALVEVGLEDAVAVLAGDRESAEATLFDAATGTIEDIAFRANRFPSAMLDRYPLRVMIALTRLLCGEAHVWV